MRYWRHWRIWFKHTINTSFTVIISFKHVFFFLTGNSFLARLPHVLTKTKVVCELHFDKLIRMFGKKCIPLNAVPRPYNEPPKCPDSKEVNKILRRLKKSSVNCVGSPFSLNSSEAERELAVRMPLKTYSASRHTKSEQAKRKSLESERTEENL